MSYSVTTRQVFLKLFLSEVKLDDISIENGQHVILHTRATPHKLRPL